MVKSDCKHCNTWEEDVYWKHFNTLHFFVTLSPNFQDHLVLPEKFAAHMKAHLPDRVSVKGPSGALWQIQLLKSDDLLFVGNEWKDFVKAYDLKENCLLMFKYERNSRFEVLIFDNGSFCEKEATYFVKQGSSTMSEQEDKKRRTEEEVVSTEIMEDDNEEDSTPVVSKKPRKDGELMACSREKSFHTPRAYRRQHSAKEIHPRLSPGKCGRRKMILSRSALNAFSLPKEYKSTRRAVTEKEKEDALLSALQEQTDASFTVALPPSAVYRRFFLTVPAAWQIKHRLRNLQEVILRVGEKTWHTTFVCYGKKGGLSAGWKTFALDNFLEEFDVLVFKPVSRTDEVVMMDVAIFRVVSTISSLLPIAYY